MQLVLYVFFLATNERNCQHDRSPCVQAYDQIHASEKLNTFNRSKIVDREIVVSVSVRAVGYDKETSKLEIEFCDSSIYRYSGVPEEVYTGFMNSMGLNLEKTDLKYFTQHIKGQYQQKTVRRPRLNLFKNILDT
jgi:hypothetical protein